MTTVIRGKSFSASGDFTLGCTITSSPGSQLIGVVTLCLSPVCSESTIRSTSAVLRPVLAGYDRIVRIIFLGSMMKTDRIVNAMPFSFTLVASWWSILSHQPHQSHTPKPLPSSSTRVFVSSHLHIIHQRHLPLLIPNNRELQLAPRDLIDILDPPAMALNRIRAQTDELDIPLREFRLELRECA